MREAGIFYTQHYINQTVTQFLAKSQKINFDRIENYKNHKINFFISYGILRGTGELFKKSKNFIYIDHGYFNSSSREFKKNNITIINSIDGYFRLIKNDFYFVKDPINLKPERFKSLKIDLKDLKKNGEFIILSEPSKNTLEFLNIPNWTENTIEEIKLHTDRKIIVHNKFSKTPLSELFKNAHAFVSCQSTAGFTSICNGIPAFFTHNSFERFTNLKDIEKKELNHDILYVAANLQWKLSEFFSDEFQEYFSSMLK